MSQPHLPPQQQNNTPAAQGARSDEQGDSPLRPGGGFVLFVVALMLWRHLWGMVWVMLPVWPFLALVALLPQDLSTEAMSGVIVVTSLGIAATFVVLIAMPAPVEGKPAGLLRRAAARWRKGLPGPITPRPGS